MMYARIKDRVDRALAEPHEARKDSTVIAMLILALYEFSYQRSLPEFNACQFSEFICWIRS